MNDVFEKEFRGIRCSVRFEKDKKADLEEKEFK